MFGTSPGSFKVNELCVPTQYYTYNFGTGVEYAKNGWLLGFQYQGSFFVDDYSTLTWDNPLNTTGVGSACVDSTIFQLPPRLPAPARDGQPCTRTTKLTTSS